LHILITKTANRTTKNALAAYGLGGFFNMQRCIKQVFCSFGFIYGIASVGSAAFAGPHRVHNPRFAGDGCPAGSVTVAESPDGSAVTLLFDRFQAEAGGATGRRVHRMFCDFTIPIEVPAGQRLGVVQVDYRGFSALPAQGRGQLLVDYLFANSRAPSFRQALTPGTPTDFLLTDRIGARALRWSECGAPVEIQGRATLTVESNPALEQALASLDTVDATRGGLIYGLQLRPCQDDPRPPRDEPHDPRHGPRDDQHDGRAPRDDSPREGHGGNRH
jgi:hypothetical protein